MASGLGECGMRRATMASAVGSRNSSDKMIRRLPRRCCRKVRTKSAPRRGRFKQRDNPGVVACALMTIFNSVPLSANQIFEHGFKIVVVGIHLADAANSIGRQRWQAAVERIWLARLDHHG